MEASSSDFTSAMAKSYKPRDVEAHWYSRWESADLFKPRPATDANHTTPFAVVLPPPNVTGHLHLNHALTGAVQDAIVRYQRMTGRETLFVPGTDHSGMATQAVVERHIQRDVGLTRHDLGRERFLETVWAFRQSQAALITRQLRMIGLSLDWSRERFTMDDKNAKAATEAFVRLHEDRKLYRAPRMVNWCCALQSAVSDLEVDFVDIARNAQVRVPGFDQAVQLGQLTHVAYKVVGSGSDEELVFATTRPETTLGDSALAVHPDDERYKKFHGKKVFHPIRRCEIPIICDSILVDAKDSSTGVVKVSPAHDRDDFDCGRRHHLEWITVFDLKGFVSLPGEFYGVHRFDARCGVVKYLEAAGLLRGVWPCAHCIGRCTRTKDMIEPMLLPQWFVETNEMAAGAIEAVKTKELFLTPSGRHEAAWCRLLERAQPWCISRQRWWGLRIPAYLVTIDGKDLGADAWVVARDIDEAKTKAIAKWSLSADEAAHLEFHRDPDVLDPSFISSLSAQLAAASSPPTALSILSPRTASLRHDQQRAIR